MTGKERRKAIIEILHNKGKDEAVSGTMLAKQLGVSRQIIVQDIALLRAKDIKIISTNNGYLIYENQKKSIQRVFCVCHDDEHMEDELNTIVDFGGTVLDVIVEHPIYKNIHVDLKISNRKEIREFLSGMKNQSGVPLNDIADGKHMHTVEAESIDILDEIEVELDKKGYLDR